MKTRFHIGENGPGKCSVDPSNPNSRGCPFGGDSGAENHFDSMKEAQQAYENEMEKEHGEIAKSERKNKKDNSNLSNALNKSLSEQNILAKETESVSELEDLAGSKSDRVKMSVLRNPNVNLKIIKKIYDTDPSYQVRNEILNNPKMSLREMNDEDFEKTFKKRDAITIGRELPMSEEKANRMLDYYENKSKNNSYYREKDLITRASALYFANRDKNGGYSEETINRLKRISSNIDEIEMLNGVIKTEDFSKVSGETYSKISLHSTPNERLNNFDEKRIDSFYENGMKNIENDSNKNGHIGINGRDPKEIKQALIVKVLDNQNINNRTMNKILDRVDDDNSQFGEFVKKKILLHHNSNEKTQNRAAYGNDKLIRELKYSKLGGREEIYKKIKASSFDIEEKTSTENIRTQKTLASISGRSNRTSYSESFRVNRSQAKRMGLDEKEIQEVLGSHFNSEASYDLKTGIFKGSSYSYG